MRTGSMKRKQGHGKGKISAGEGRRAVITTVALTGVMLLGFFVTASSYRSPGHSDGMSASKITPLMPSEKQGEAAHRVGSIVVEADKKGRCEERQFDNRTGKMVSANYVDCDVRLERDTTPSETVNRERIRAILGAFKK